MHVQWKEYYMTQLGGRCELNTAETVLEQLKPSRLKYLTHCRAEEEHKVGHPPLSTLRSRKETLQAQRVMLLKIM